MPYSDVTLPELARRIERDNDATRLSITDMRTEMREDIAGLRAELQAAAVMMVPGVKYEIEQQHQDERITALEAAAAQARELQEKRKMLVYSSFAAPIIVALVMSYMAARGLI